MSDREGMDLFQFELGTNLQKGNAFSDNVRCSVICCTHLCMSLTSLALLENGMTESMEEDKTTTLL